MNAVWLVENPFYQYENFKNIIDYMKADVYSTSPRNAVKKEDKGLYHLDGTPVDINSIEGKYDFIIKTGSGTLPKHIDILSITKSGRIVQISHSIAGLKMDQTTGLPLSRYNERSGIYVEAWKSLPGVRERLKIIEDKRKSKYVTSCKTHPFMVKVLEPLHSDIEEKTLGLLLSNVGGVGPFVKRVLNGAKLRNKKFDKIYIKRHPMNTTLNTKVFEPLYEITKEIEVIPASSDKNAFFDRCETLCIGQSSTFFEANLRSNYYKSKQEIYGIDEYVRIAMQDYLFSEHRVEFTDWESETPYKKWTKYDEMLEIDKASEIFDEVIAAINKNIESLQSKEDTQVTQVTQSIDEW